MNVFSTGTEDFVAELDAATEAHLDWTRRVLRCAVRRRSPGEDVMAPDAHDRCRFGRWFRQNRDRFDDIDAVAAERVRLTHHRMHDAVRQLCTTLLAHGQDEAAALDTFERMQSALIADLAHFKTQVLAQSARHDALTGLPLRYGLEDEFRRCLGAAQRRAEMLVVAMVDIDHFKLVNDTHGHAVGDRALQHMAALLKSHSRIGEPVFRFGGEEFLVLIQATGRDEAGKAVDRLLQALRTTPLPLADGALLSLRASAGLAVVGQDEAMANAVERADRALYAAKATGRDRWCWDSDAVRPRD